MRLSSAIPSVGLFISWISPKGLVGVHTGLQDLSALHDTFSISRDLTPMLSYELAVVCWACVDRFRGWIHGAAGVQQAVVGMTRLQRWLRTSSHYVFARFHVQSVTSHHQEHI